MRITAEPALRGARAVLRLLPGNSVVRVPFGPMRGMKWMPASMPHGAWLGRLERAQLDQFIACLRSGATVWDIGANVGLYAIPSARAVGPRGRVVAFEPIPRNVGFLRRHIALNRLTCVEVVEAAVSDATGTIAMAPGDSPSEAHLADSGPWQVPVLALDEWSARTGAAAPDLIKIDVEGAEDRVLLGARRILASASPVIFLSLHGDRQRDRCAAILNAARYRVVSLQPGVEPGRASEWRAERTGSVG